MRDLIQLDYLQMKEIGRRFRLASPGPADAGQIPYQQLERSRNPGWKTLNAYAAACGFRLRLVAERR